MGVAYYWAPETWYSMKREDARYLGVAHTCAPGTTLAGTGTAPSGEAPHPVEVTGDRPRS